MPFRRINYSTPINAPHVPVWSLAQINARYERLVRVMARTLFMSNHEACEAIRDYLEARPTSRIATGSSDAVIYAGGPDVAVRASATLAARREYRETV